MKIFLCALVFFVFTSNIFPQITGLPSYQKEMSLGDEYKNLLQQQISTEKEVFPTTSIVIDTFYQVGPNDIFSILISPTNVNPELTKVSSDGQLILSRYGFLDVKGKNLAQVKKDVELFVKEFNPNANVSLSLYKPRTCFVKITGNVRKPGIYYLPASYRISDAVAIANQEYTTQEAPMNKLETSMLVAEMERKRESEFIAKGIPADIFYSTRNIFIYNQIYGLSKADLELSKSRNAFEFNPYIREGDEIYVPYPPSSQEYVTISGAVVQPGKYTYKKGDKLSDLLKFAKGFKENANISSIIVQSEKGTEKVQLDPALNPVSDFELEPYTNVIVEEVQPLPNSKTGVAGIYGCVQKPGIYLIEIGKTRILDLINSAGGIACEPSFSNSFILRSYPQRQFWDEPSIELFKMFKQSNLKMEDTTRFKMDLLTKGHFVSCDLFDLIVKKDERQNLLLSDGDLIFLPPSKGSIYVWGQVKNPGYLPYEKDKTVEWYIEKAGGYLSTAKKSRVRIIRGPQKVWLKPDNITLLDGDEIYVPGEPDLPPGTEYQYYSLIATGIATLISLTYLIINLTTRRN